MPPFRDPADPLWEQTINGLKEARRLVAQTSGVFLESSAVGTYFAPPAGAFLKATALKLSYGTEKSAPLYELKESVYQNVPGGAKLTLEVTLAVDNVAPTASFIFGLYKVKEIKGATEKAIEPEYEAVLAGSTTEFTLPAKETLTTKTVTFPFPATGVYSPGVETITATSAAKSFEVATISLFASN